MTEKRGRGRPKYKPGKKDRDTVKSMAAYGIPQDEISTVLGIAPKTLREHFRQELDTAMTIANAKVVESLYKNAVGGNVTAQIWWTKGRMGWKERQELTGKDGEAMKVEVSAVDEILKRIADIAAHKE